MVAATIQSRRPAARALPARSFYRSDRSNLVRIHPAGSASPPPSGLRAELRVAAHRRARVTPAVYRRRRLAALGLLLLLIAAAFVLVQSALAGAGGGSLASTGAAATSSVMSPAGTAVWVVRPGDTLWSIAGALDRSGDIRPLVDRLSALTAGGQLYPGQRIPIPAPYG